jgi:hypothetical protein
VPVSGGEEQLIHDRFTPHLWSMTESSIYFFTRDQAFDAIDRLDLATQQVTRVGKLGARIADESGQLAVSPNGRLALVAHQQNTVELTLIENP